MSVARSAPAFISREEYRRWYDAQPRGRFERHDGEIVAMAAERAGHARMKLAIVNALARAVAHAGLRCQALPDGVTVETGESAFEPDALVNCGEPMGDDDIAAPNPVVVVEVLSPGTAAIDTGAKLAGYFRVPSVQHYLVVHPTKRNVVHYRREGDRIAAMPLAAGPVELDPPGISLDLDELYGAS